MKAAQASIRRGLSPDLSTLEVWDQQFAALSARITATRATIAQSLMEPAARSYDDVADSPRRLRLAFDASVDRVIGTDPERPASSDLTDVDAQTQRMHAALKAVREKETERGINLVGAHRDDLTLSLGAMPVKGYASHGESWSVALALRLGAFELLGEDGDTPRLILGARTRALRFFLRIGQDLCGALVGLVEGGGGTRVGLGDARLSGGIGTSQDGVRVGDDGVSGDEVLGQGFARLVEQVEDLGLIDHDASGERNRAGGLDEVFDLVESSDDG